ncbi:MAG: AAA family ATPase [Verrucomicrobia bacterium]|nr:AAA family ATPase [Verrucomicrobiota bacterium]
MIESIEFKNFKVLRNATLPLGKFTLIVGPNGSGKSTVFRAIDGLAGRYNANYNSIISAGRFGSNSTLKAVCSDTGRCIYAQCSWQQDARIPVSIEELRPGLSEQRRKFAMCLNASRQYALNPHAIAAHVSLRPEVELGSQGNDLAGVLDRLRDSHPEQFDALNRELGKWLPEFDQVLFETPSTGTRALLLRTRSGGHKIKAVDLSEGTLIALAILTLAYLPKPPPLVCFEEPDHGLHPRLLRDVRDAIYRLAYPESFGEKRDPVQVIATTHNPYFLDLFRDHPEEIVIAEKNGLEATFSRLVDRTDLSEILGDANLGEVWYSGVLGGVPAGT